MPRDHGRYEKAHDVNALRTLLDGIVDYAGLFPPAALDMTTAVRNYASYLAERDAWMLGRFVVPIGRLGELDAVPGGFPATPEHPWRLAALAGMEPHVDRARAFNAEHRRRATIDVLETKASSVEEIDRIAAATGRDFTTFVELPSASDLEPLLAAIKRRGLSAKIRTGGVVADAFPSAELVMRFIRSCLRAGVPFKATAGLHHPVRATYRLTYDAGGPTGIMFGYLNVFVAAALMASGLNDDEAVRVLDERDPNAFVLRAHTVAWRGHVITADEARRVREHVAVSFGSCSFREPVDELKALALAPTQ
jgi:hypothetical protein